MNVGSLFSGVGGFDLGLERAGMRVLWQCESDPFCRRVLAKHWPGVPCYPDVRELGVGAGDVDVLCGGFPCQDISGAGKRVGIDGERSGLWAEYARLVGELRPRYVVVENVADLLIRGLGRVLGDLAALGYDAEWDCIPARAVGAPHLRDRIWIVAYPRGDGTRDESQELADADNAGRREQRWPESVQAQLAPAERSGEVVADAQGGGGGSQWPHSAAEAGADVGLGRASGQWEVEPDVGRVADGVPARVDRLRALGNALVPQIAEWIGRRIMTFEASAGPYREELT